MPAHRMHHQHAGQHVHIQRRHQRHASAIPEALVQPLHAHRQHHIDDAQQRLRQSHHGHATAHKVPIERGEHHRQHDAEADALQQAVGEQQLFERLRHHGGQAAGHEDDGTAQADGAHRVACEQVVGEDAHQTGGHVVAAGQRGQGAGVQAEPVEEVAEQQAEGGHLAEGGDL